MLRNVIIREIKRLCRQPIFWFAAIGAPLFCYVFFLTLMANGLAALSVQKLGTTPSMPVREDIDAFLGSH